MDREFMRMVVLAIVAVVLMVQCAVAQTEHVVGDSLGWDIPPNGAQTYINWASTKTFVVGDILIFNFGTNQHDVVQVPKESYDACSSNNAIGNPITEGPANITLSSAGEHYVICTFGRHCQAGQKLSITVSATPGGAAPPPTANTPRTPVTPSPTSSTDDACAPVPSTTPTVGGPTPSSGPVAVPPPPPPSSSSSAVLATFSLTLLAIAVGFLI